MAAEPEVIARWHEIVAARDLAGLDDLLDEAVIFQSPAVHTPQVGKDKAMRYLGAALRVLANGNFRYIGEWYGASSAVLEFETLVEGMQLNGVDMIHWDAADRIVRFKVMVRPFKALQVLMPLMATELEKHPSGATS